MKHASPATPMAHAPATPSGDHPSARIHAPDGQRQAAVTGTAGLGRRRLLALALAGAAAVAGLVGPVGPGGVAEARTCQEAAIAERAGAAFLAAAKAGSAPAFAKALATHADMQQVTLFALGRYRQQLSPNRRAKLVRLTSSYVSSALADFAASFRASTIEAVGCRSGLVVSRLEFANGSTQRVLWRINRGKVIDVNVQNMWLSHALRDHYASLIRRGGGSLDALFLGLTSDQSRG